MGFACYGNLGRSAAISTTGFTNGDRLADPNLSPAAEMAADNTITFNWSGSQDVEVDAVAILGLRYVDTAGGFEFNVPPDERRLSFSLESAAVSTFTQLEANDIVRIRQTPFSYEHYIIKLPQRTTMRQLRVNINGSLVGASGFIGCIRPMLMVEDQALFAQSGAFRPVPTSRQTPSQGGQRYSSSGVTTREILVQHGNMPQWLAHGGLPNPIEVDLGGITVPSGVTLSNGEFFRTNTTGGSNSLEWNNTSAIVIGSVHELRYHLWTEDGPGFCSVTTSTARDLPLGNTFRRWLEDITTTSLLISLSAQNGQRWYLKEDVKLFRESKNQDKARKLIAGGWDAVIASTENGNPILVVESPDPLEQAFTGYWGNVVEWGDYRRIGNSLTTGSFNIAELV